MCIDPFFTRLAGPGLLLPSKMALGIRKFPMEVHSERQLKADRDVISSSLAFGDIFAGYRYLF